MEALVKELKLSEDRVSNLLKVGQECLNKFETAAEWFQSPTVLMCDLSAENGYVMDSNHLTTLPENMQQVIQNNFERHREERSINLFYIFDNIRLIIVPAD